MPFKIVRCEIHEFDRPHVKFSEQDRTASITNVVLFVLQLRLRGMIYSQVAQLKDLFDKEMLTRDQFEKEREKLVNELVKVE